MAVRCPMCGRVSQDPEFCDYCNADLAPPAPELVPERCPLLGQGIELTYSQRAGLSRSGHSLVLPVDGELWRLRWLPAQGAAKWQPLLEERSRFALKALPVSRWAEDEKGIWVATASSGRPVEPWNEPPATNHLEELHRLFRFASTLAETLEELHEHGLVWLNFDPVELEWAGNPTHGAEHLQITNLDLEIYRVGYCPENLSLKPAFAPPEVYHALGDEISPRTDVYYLALFCYYWLARRLPAGFPGAGLEAFAFQLPPLRTYVPDLLPGLVGVLNKSLSLDPHRRHAGPRALMGALRIALEGIEKRLNFAGSLNWDIGAHTRTGRAKSAAQGENEDTILVKEFADPPRALLVVADGITTCDVGTGAMASSMTKVVLEETFVDTCSADQFPALIVEACDRATYNLLDWALVNGHESTLLKGLDLMGTTLNVGWLEGHALTLANIGDSRAYLLEGQNIEQLTVDGDLGSGLLAGGTPPEQVRDLGGLAKALRECIGGCQIGNDGQLQPLSDCQPALTNFPLLPGDILVLCSDGLVEEGAFLDTNALVEIIGQNMHLSAQDLALLLADEADARQRLPSPLDPEGFGDNISCIVIKISG